MQKNLSKAFKEPWVLCTLIFFVITYLLATFSFPIISDEFHEAVEVQHLFERVPYKDYFYYKNVLGYYLKYPFLHFFDSWFNSILFSRFILALFWIGSLFLFLIKLGSRYKLSSILVSLGLGLALTNNLLHAASYRVDLLTTLFGMASFLFFKDKKFFWAGVLASLSFFVSQKGIWFCLSGFINLLYWRETRKEVISFLRGGFLVGILYVGGFSLFSSPSDVLFGIFLKDLDMAGAAGYQIRHFWSQSFFENWPFWIFSGAGISLSLMTNEEGVNKDKIAVPFSLFFIFLFSLNPQSWPYNFVYITPFLCMFILVFWEVLTNKFSNKITSGILIIALLIPFLNLFRDHRITNGHQRQAIENLEQILNREDTYIAGFNLLPNNKQVHSFFNWLNAIERRKAFNLSSNEIKKLFEAWDKKPAKALVQNYRMKSLPQSIQSYFLTNYHHFWGNIYLRSMVIKPYRTDYSVPFTGSYILFSSSNQSKPEILWKDKKIKVGDVLKLTKGEVQLKINTMGTLMFFPGKMNLSKKYKNQQSLNFSYD